MYQNSYHSYSYPYAYYPPYPSHSPHSSKNKRSKGIEPPIVKQELKEAQPISYPLLSEVENKVETAEKEESTFKEVKEVDTFTKRFLNYLGKRKGTTVSVTTSAEVIKGTLEEVSSDCILVRANEESYHIRPEGIIYFK